MLTEAVGDQPDAVRVARLGVGQVDLAGQRPGERRAFEGQRADLRRLRALRRFVPDADPRLLGRACALAVRRVGVDRDSNGEADRAALDWEGVGATGLSAGGTLRSTSSPEGVSVRLVVG